jgi:outer membrane receptor protein involved in Fe transport
MATLAVFQAKVASELVFDAEQGGLEAEGASTRRGLLGSLIARPAAWLLGSIAVTWARATFDDPPPGDSERVPGVIPLLVRADVAVRRPLTRIGEHPLVGRVGSGYTWVSGRPRTDGEYGSFVSIMNASAGVRYRELEIGIDVFNLFDRRYPDTESVFESNWSTAAVPPPASKALHFSAAAPRIVIGSLTLHL